MSVGRICSRSVVTVRAGESVLEAARRMAHHSVGTLVVTAPGEEPREEAPHPIGILTDRDIVVRCVAQGLDPGASPVSAVMSVPVRFLHEDAAIEEALGVMSRGAMRRIVVTDAAGRLVGILSLDDVIELLVEEAGSIGRLLVQHAPTRL